MASLATPNRRITAKTSGTLVMLSLLTPILSLQKQFLACYWALIKTECLIYGTPCDYQPQVFIINWVLSDLQNHETGFSQLQLIRNWSDRGSSLVVQWLRTCLQCRGRGFDPWLENEGPTSLRATKPARHNYWTHAPQLESPRVGTKDPSWCNEDPVCCDWDLRLSNKRNWSGIYDTGPTLIQKAQINYMSRWLRFPWHQFLQFHLFILKGSKGRRRKDRPNFWKALYK